MSDLSNYTARPHLASEAPQLALSAYDRVSSMLIALLILVSTVVTGLLIVYLSARVFARPRAVPVTLASIVGEGGGSGASFGTDLEPMGLDDQVSSDESHLIETLDALPQIVSQRSELLETIDDQSDTWDVKGDGPGSRPGGGRGSGGIVERTPRAERWEIRFQAERLTDYARQLDHFGIELGMLGSDNRVHYAYNLAKSIPDRRTGPPESEGRLHMVWRAGPLAQADYDLLERAGIDPQGRIILQFYPPETEETLARKELEHADGRGVNEIRKTVFGVKQAGDGYEFYVMEQLYWK
ncbi:MAG: hypothetical protein ACC645_08670 [Pirellulales bacterium]